MERNDRYKLGKLFAVSACEGHKTSGFKNFTLMWESISESLSMTSALYAANQLLLPANYYFKSIYHSSSFAFQKGVIRGVMLGIKYMGADRGGSGGLVVNVASMAGNTFSNMFLKATTECGKVMFSVLSGCSRERGGPMSIHTWTCSNLFTMWSILLSACGRLAFD